MAYVWTNKEELGETLLSPSAGVTTASGDSISVTVPAFPAQATNVAIYIEDTPGSGNLYLAAYSNLTTVTILNPPLNTQPVPPLTNTTSSIGTGWDIVLAGGLGFAGADQGGSIRCQTAIAGAGTTLVDRFRITPDGAEEFVGLSTPPAVSAANEARVYFDTGTELLMQSTNGTPYVPIGSGSSSDETIVPYTVDTAFTSADKGHTATNTGATGSVTLTLPVLVVGQVFLFACTVAQPLIVANFDATTTINLGTTTGTAGGTVTASMPGSYLRVVGVSPTQWFAEIVTGGLTPS